MKLKTAALLFLVSIFLFSGALLAKKKESRDLGPGDLANGAELYRKCALCHGQFGQGTAGGLYPRLAGLPKHYILSQMKKYVDGSRSDAFSTAMLEVGGMKYMTDKEANDLASFLAAIDLDKYYPLELPKPGKGDPKNGKALYKDDCKDCHGKKGQGKEKKEAPPLAGQYTEYLMRETDAFKAKERYHDNDPEDETFDDYTKAQLEDIFAYVATLEYTPEKGYPEVADLPLLAKAAPHKAAKKAKRDEVKIELVSQTVLKMPLQEGVTAEDAVAAMLSMAAEKNMRNVGHQQVSKELEARGIESPRLEIFQFCRPEDAIKMVRFNTIFAAYMPCRIALVEDSDGKLWLEMLNLDMVINSVALPPELNKIAIETNGTMLDILTAGATGEF